MPYMACLSYSSKFRVVALSSGERTKSRGRFVKYDTTTDTEFFRRAFSCDHCDVNHLCTFSSMIFVEEKAKKILIVRRKFT
jgi:hypothetical protein